MLSDDILCLNRRRQSISHLQRLADWLVTVQSDRLLWGAGSGNNTRSVPVQLSSPETLSQKRSCHIITQEALRPGVNNAIAK